MRAPFLRRLVAVFSVLTLLLTGFATTSVAANTSCGMDMAAAAASGTPCDEHGKSDGPEKMRGAATCLAPCAVPLPEHAAKLPPQAMVERSPHVPREYYAQAGISIAPPLEPPRA